MAALGADVTVLRQRKVGEDDEGRRKRGGSWSWRSGAPLKMPVHCRPCIGGFLDPPALALTGLNFPAPVQLSPPAAGAPAPHAADVCIRRRGSASGGTPLEVRVAIIGNVDSGKSTMVRSSPTRQGPVLLMGGPSGRAPRVTEPQPTVSGSGRHA